MYRFTPFAAACCAFAAVVSIASASDGRGQDHQTRADWFSGPEVEYLNTYEECWRKLSSECGRNIVDDGRLVNGEVTKPSTDEVQAATGRLNTLMNPPPAPEPAAEPVATSTASTTAAAPAAPVSTSGGTGCTGMEAESGSAGYSAYNPSSGATGCYQIIPSTAAAYSCDLSTPAGQDTCAARICEGQGAGAWAASGVSPC